MSQEMLSIIVAACVGLAVGMLTFIASLIVGLLSFTASFLTVRGQIKGIKMDFEERYRKAIFDKRLAAYAEVWRITALLSSRRLGSCNRIDIAEVKSAVEQVDKWYNETIGGLLVSQESRKCFFNLREMLNMLSNEANRSKELYSEIWRRKMDFRVSLRSDLIVESLESKAYRRHFEKEWKLD